MEPELLIPASAPTEEPFSQRWGLVPHYSLRVPIQTSISESGLGHSFGLTLHIAESFNDRYTLAVEFPFATTDTKLFPTTNAEGTTAEHSHWGGQLGMGRVTRSLPYFGDLGAFKFALNVGVTPMIGFGKSTITAPDRTLEGETFSFGSRSATTWDLGTSYTFTGEWRPAGGRGPAINIGPGAYYGVQYDKPGSEFNRVRLDFMLMASIGYLDGSTRTSADADAEVGAMAIVQDIFSFGQGMGQAALLDRAVSKPMEALGDYGLTGGGETGTPSSMDDVPFLKGGAVFAGSFGNPMYVPLHAGTGWFYGLTAMRAVGGTVLVATSSTEGGAGGVANLWTVGRMLSYAIAGIEEPSKRAAKAPEDVEHKEAYIDLAFFAASAALMMVPNDTVKLGSGSANFNIGMTPGALGSGTIERTDVGYIPYAPTWSGKRSGGRGGFFVNKDFHDFPSANWQLFSSVAFLAPMLNPGSDRDLTLDTSLMATLGIAWKTPWTRLSVGPTTSLDYGTGGTRTGIGASAGFDVTIPFNGQEDGSGLGFGIRGNALKYSSEGAQYNIMPWAGVSLCL